MTTTTLLPMGEEALVYGDQLEQIIKSQLPDVHHILFDIVDPHKTYSETDIKALRTRQAEDLCGHIVEIYQTIQGNLIILGWILIQGELLELYKYIGEGYKSMQDWSYHMHIPKSTYEHALTLGKAWPYLHELGIELKVLADERFTLTKARHVLQMGRDATRQKKAIIERLRDEEYDNDESEDSEEQREKAPVKLLDAETERDIRHRADEEYRASARSKILSVVLELSDDDLIYEEQRSRGEKERPRIGIRLDYARGVCHVQESDFACTQENIEALKRNQYDLYFLLAQEPQALSAKALGERLEERSISELDDESVESF